MNSRRIVLLAGSLLLFGAGCLPTLPSPVPGPGPAPSPTPITCGGAYGSCPRGYQCVQDCGPPVVREGDAPPGYHCLTDAEAAKPRMCPICLAADTKIATPDGDKPVTDLKAGMQVWTLSADGSRVSAPIVNIGNTPTSAGQSIVNLTLEDRRNVSVSSGHPLIEGGTVADLKAGDPYDGSTVRSIESVPYESEATYDLLPEGATGAYWANGILLRSTLGP
jgi:hypothetical protein